jgi:hypothetical protein
VTRSFKRKDPAILKLGQFSPGYEGIRFSIPDACPIGGLALAVNESGRGQGPFPQVSCGKLVGLPADIKKGLVLTETQSPQYC